MHIDPLDPSETIQYNILNSTEAAEATADESTRKKIQELSFPRPLIHLPKHKKISASILPQEESFSLLAERAFENRVHDQEVKEIFTEILVRYYP